MIMNRHVVDNVKEIRKKEWEKRCNDVEEILRRAAGYPKEKLKNSPYLFEISDAGVRIKMYLSEYERFRTEWYFYKLQLQTRGFRVQFPSLCERICTFDNKIQIIIEFDYSCRYL